MNTTRKMSLMLLKGCLLGNAVLAASAQAEDMQLLASLNTTRTGVIERSLLDTANAGDANAQLALAKIYESQHSTGKLVEWYRKSALNGNAEAQFQLGLLYIDGELADGDRDAGLFWVEQAAGQGHFRARVLQKSLEEEDILIGC